MTFRHNIIARAHYYPDGTLRDWHGIDAICDDGIHYYPDLISHGVQGDGFYGNPNRPANPTRHFATATEAARYAVDHSSGIDWTPELASICAEIDATS